MRFGIVLLLASTLVTSVVLTGAISAQSSESGVAEMKCLSVSQKVAWEQAKSDAGGSVEKQPVLNSMTTEFRPQSILGSPINAIRVSFELQNHGNRTYEIHTQTNETKSVCSVARVSAIK